MRIWRRWWRWRERSNCCHADRGQSAQFANRVCVSKVELRVLMEPSWAVLEFELASALHGVIKKYWQRQSVRRDMLFRPNPQVR